MKRPEGRLVAMLFEYIILANGGRSAQLYAIEHVPGVFRRVARTPVSSRPESHLVAYYGDKEIELVRDLRVEEELSQAGFVHETSDVTKLNAAERKAILFGLFQGAQSKEDGENEVACPLAEKDVPQVDHPLSEESREEEAEVEPADEREEP